LKKSETIWITIDGDELSLKSIKTSHLMNIINYLKRHDKNNKRIKIFEKELRLRKLNNIDNNPDYKDIF